MTQDEIIEMAKQVGYNSFEALKWKQTLTDFAKLVAEKERAKFAVHAVNIARQAVEKERKACWNILFDYAGRDDLTPEDESLLKHIADLIQARGES